MLKEYPGWTLDYIRYRLSPRDFRIFSTIPNIINKVENHMAKVRENNKKKK